MGQLLKISDRICMGKQKNLLTTIQSLCTLCAPKKSPRPDCANNRLRSQRCSPFLHSASRSRVMRFFWGGGGREVQGRERLTYPVPLSLPCTLGPTYPVPLTNLPCTDLPTLYLPKYGPKTKLFASAVRSQPSSHLPCSCPRGRDIRV